MRPTVIVPIIAILLMAAPTAHAARQKGEHLLLDMPTGWSEKSRAREGNVQTAQWTPADQPLRDWKDLITIQIHTGGLGDERTDKDYFATLSQEMSTLCPGVRVQPLSEGTLGGYKVLLWRQYCGEVPGKQGRGEVTMFKTIQGNSSFYVIQRAWNVRKFKPSREPVSKRKLAEAEEFLLHRTGLCDTEATDERRCP